MTKQEQAMRLYQAIERLSLQAGEDVDEAIDWLCGESGGMFKLYQQYFSPKQPRTWVGIPESAFAGMTLQQVSAMKYAELICKEKNI